MVATPTTDPRLNRDTVTRHQSLDLTTNFFYDPSTLMTNNHWFFNNKICTSHCLSSKIINKNWNFFLEKTKTSAEIYVGNHLQIKIFKLIKAPNWNLASVCFRIQEAKIHASGQCSKLELLTCSRFLCIGTREIASKWFTKHTLSVSFSNVFNIVITCNNNSITYLEVVNITPTDSNSFHSNSDIMRSFKHAKWSKPNLAMRFEFYEID